MSLSPSKTGTIGVRGAETQRRILDAALARFAEQGFAGTTIPAVMGDAGVGAGSLYRLFPSKEALVNAVFRDAKARLGAALRGALTPSEGDRDLATAARASFDGLWERLSRFANEEPVAFRFLELQDHVPYLDGESRQLELSVLAPLLLSCLDLQRRGVFRAELGADVMMALVWGAFVGLVKAERLGYVRRSAATDRAAGDAAWRALATDAARDVQTATRETRDVDPKKKAPVIKTGRTKETRR